MNTKAFFKFKEHPGDFFRNTDLVKLPDINKDFDEFLIQFLPNYQSDNTVTYLDDLYKLLFDEFESICHKKNFISTSGITCKEKIQEEIELTIERLKYKALDNFYRLLYSQKIEVLNSI